MSKPENGYHQALLALKNRDYPAASGFLKSVENQFADSLEFRILHEMTKLLLVVKEEIFELEHKKVEV